MDILTNSEDQDERLQGLLRHKAILREKMYLKSITCDPSINIMGPADFTLSNFMGRSIGSRRSNNIR